MKVIFIYVFFSHQNTVLNHQKRGLERSVYCFLLRKSVRSNEFYGKISGDRQYYLNIFLLQIITSIFY
jgi:hypothetical protein